MSVQLESTDPPVMFSPEESRHYWDVRHARFDSLSSGGNVSMGQHGNAVFYAVRMARLVEVLGSRTSGAAPLRVLDAGCGKGVFTRGMGAFGYSMDGIDTSATAIAQCRAFASPGERYEVSSLTRWRPPYLYDAVLCIDVLYHLMDDDEWEASLRNLGSLVRLGGRLAVVDHLRDEDIIWGRYQRTRASSRYAAVFAEMGFGPIRQVANNLDDDPAGFHVGVKVA